MSRIPGAVVAMAIGFFGAGVAPRPLAASSLGGPMPGFVFDPQAKAIRPVLGMPGAATLGPAVAVGMPLQRAAVHGRHGIALACLDSDGSVRLVRGMRGEQVEVMALAHALESADLVVLNESGQAGALYSGSAGKVQFLSGLLGEPSVSATADVSGLRGTVKAMALDASGTALLLAVQGEGRGGIYALRLGSEGSVGTELVARGMAPSAVTFLGEGALFADEAANEIVRISKVEPFAETSVAAGEADGVSGPVGVQVAAGKILAANRGTSMLMILDLATGTVERTVALSAVPTRVAPLEEGSIFLLNETSQPPLLMVDALQRQSVYFVPVN